MSKKKVIRRPHDTFFKNSMSRPKVALEFFERRLPSDILQKVDLTTLHQEKESFLDKDLGNGYVDTLFSVKLKDNEIPGYFYILCEQQTKQEHTMAFRMQKYMLRICEHHLKKNKPDKTLPFIFPIVLYAGEPEYKVPLDFFELFADPILAKRCFTEPYKLVDLHRMEDDEIRQRVWSGLMEFVLKKAPHVGISRALWTISDIIVIIGKEDFLYIEDTFEYIGEVSNTNDIEEDEEIIDFFAETLSDKRGEIMTTMADRFREQGKLEGIDIGRIEGIDIGKLKGKLEEKHSIAITLLKKNSDVSFISEVTGLSEGEILKLQKGLKRLK